MQLHAIEVDDEVLAHLKAKILDFGETPNSVLRRELRISTSESPTMREAQEARVAAPAVVVGQTIGIPLGVPQALSQIFEVSLLVRRGGCDRVTATLQVAKRRGIARETVGDKYARQLGVSTEEFDRLLQAPDLTGLRRLLLEKFPHHRVEILTFLDVLSRYP